MIGKVTISIKGNGIRIGQGIMRQVINIIRRHIISSMHLKNDRDFSLRSITRFQAKRLYNVGLVAKIIA